MFKKRLHDAMLDHKLLLNLQLLRHHPTFYLISQRLREQYFCVFHSIILLKA